jgi:hypothetical protein
MNPLSKLFDACSRPEVGKAVTAWGVLILVLGVMLGAVMWAFAFTLMIFPPAALSFAIVGGFGLYRWATS